MDNRHKECHREDLWLALSIHWIEWLYGKRYIKYLLVL